MTIDKKRAIAASTILALGLGVGITASQVAINSTHYAPLSDASWNNVMTFNNLFPDNPTVTNHMVNEESIVIRIEHSIDGQQVTNEVTIAPGESKQMGLVPARFGLQGDYTVQAKIISDTEQNANYLISVD